MQRNSACYVTPPPPPNHPNPTWHHHTPPSSIKSYVLIFAWLKSAWLQCIFPSLTVVDIHGQWYLYKLKAGLRDNETSCKTTCGMGGKGEKRIIVHRKKSFSYLFDFNVFPFCSTNFGIVSLTVSLMCSSCPFYRIWFISLTYHSERKSIAMLFTSKRLQCQRGKFVFHNIKEACISKFLEILW